MNSFYLCDDFERQIVFFLVSDGVESVSELLQMTAKNYRADLEHSSRPACQGGKACM